MSIPPGQPIGPDAVLVGSYSLETLTTGMYEQPLHCVREYVQNAYDAIGAARHATILPENGGTVTIAITGSAARPTLSVRDDGAGIPAAEAVSTLVSIGASKKRSNVNAGFRGIGRLAGIAYCTTLRFTTSAVGEETGTVVEFDCARMRDYMKPGAEVRDVREVIRLCTKSRTITARPQDHFTEVEMIGLVGVGLEFAEIERLVPYLRQVCPTDYSDRFSQAAKIRSFAETLGHPIVTVEVETKYKRERTQILKAYDNSSPTANPRSPSIVTDIEPIHSAELGWHGWIGKSTFKGELTDDTVAGVRFRIKNIQIDGSDIIEDLASELTVGGTEGRLQRWAIGEIFITNPAVVPNARRDGFEDSQAWRDIRKDIKARVARRVVTLVRAASNGRKALRTIVSETIVLENSLKREWIDQATADRVIAAVDRLLARLTPEKMSGGDPTEVGEQVAKLKALKDKVVELRSRPEPQPDPEPDPEPEEPKPEDTDSEDDGGKSPGEDQPDPGAEPGAGTWPWPAEDILRAVTEVMIDDLGEEETHRLFGLARALLESRG
jgi:molecular chaperone HtpG